MICLTFDVEERFHSHLTPADAPRRWSAGDRIERILDFLEAQGHRATFFVVSELAGRASLQSKAEELGISTGDGSQFVEVLERIKELEARGFAFEAAEASVAMMLEYSAGEIDCAKKIEAAVDAALNSGQATRDIGGKLNTDKMTDAVIEQFHLL